MTAERRLPFEGGVTLLLQGGGARGISGRRYAGASRSDIIRIGSPASHRRDQRRADRGNAPERRVEQLRKFWEQMTALTHGLDAGLSAV